MRLIKNTNLAFKATPGASEYLLLLWGLLVICLPRQMSGGTAPSKTDLEGAFSGMNIVSKTDFGVKTKPVGDTKSFVQTSAYPKGRVVYQVGFEVARLDDDSKPPTFSRGTFFEITHVDLKGDQLCLRLRTLRGDSVLLNLMLRPGWQSTFDLADIKADVADFFTFQGTPGAEISNSATASVSSPTAAIPNSDPHIGLEDSTAQARHDRPYGTATDSSDGAALAANAGDALAQNHLAQSYYTGKGEPQDYAQAAIWYRKSAEQGNAEAQGMLGYLYYAGQGVAQDDTLAGAWFRKGAEQGDNAAQRGLGGLYAMGRGVPENFAEAYFWFSIAAARLRGSLQTLITDGCNVAAAKLTPTELSNGKLRVSQWLGHNATRSASLPYNPCAAAKTQNVERPIRESGEHHALRLTSESPIGVVFTFVVVDGQPAIRLDLVENAMGYQDALNAQRYMSTPGLFTRFYALGFRRFVLMEGATYSVITLSAGGRTGVVEGLKTADLPVAENSQAKTNTEAAGSLKAQFQAKAHDLGVKKGSISQRASFAGSLSNTFATLHFSTCGSSDEMLLGVSPKIYDPFDGQDLRHFQNRIFLASLYTKGFRYFEVHDGKGYDYSFLLTSDGPVSGPVPPLYEHCYQLGVNALTNTHIFMVQ